MLPLKDNVPTRSFPVVTVGLIVVNVIVWLWEWTGTSVDVDVARYAYYPCSVDGPCVGAAATPEGYEPAPEAVELAREAGGSPELLHDPRQAVEGADVLYTDVWTSMGQDAERERRLRDLAGFGIDERLVGLAGEDAIVLHCLPAHYGEEITEEVLYGPQSAVWDQAENRLHSQRALMALVIR